MLLLKPTHVEEKPQKASVSIEAPLGVRRCSSAAVRPVAAGQVRTGGLRSGCPRPPIPSKAETDEAAPHTAAPSAAFRGELLLAAVSGTAAFVFRLVAAPANPPCVTEHRSSVPSDAPARSAAAQRTTPALRGAPCSRHSLGPGRADQSRARQGTAGQSRAGQARPQPPRPMACARPAGGSAKRARARCQETGARGGGGGG